MSENNFVWNEETAKEYGKFCVLKNSWLQWEDFKNQKQPPKSVFNEEILNSRLNQLAAMEQGFNLGKSGKYKTFYEYQTEQSSIPLDYEILKIGEPSWHEIEWYERKGNGFQNSLDKEGRSEEELLKIYHILSVKRLSDGEVFTVGEKVDDFSYDNRTIKGFFIEKDVMWINQDWGCSKLSDLKKVKNHAPKPPLGVIPLRMHNEKRLDEINEAIIRYAEANLDIPKEWFSERESLIAYLKTKD